MPASKGGRGPASYPVPVSEESHREEMNAAIRAQRERGAVPRSMLPPEDESPAPTPAPEPEPAPPVRRRLLSRLPGLRRP